MAGTICMMVSATPLASDCSLWNRRSNYFKSGNVNLFVEERAPMLALKLKTNNIIGRPARRANDQIVCVPTQQAIERKNAVAPPELEDATRPPTNLYSAEAPHTVTIRSVGKLTGPEAPEETYHIVFDHRGFLPYWEGQVFGAMPPPENPFEPGDATTLRYFSAASSRYGDNFDGQTASLCVSRGSAGSVSDYMCSSKPGDKLQLTGPTREAMLLGDYSPNATHIFVATGTGVAPFRAHLRRFFGEDIPSFEFNGLAWLFYGVSNSDSLLYGDEFFKYIKSYPENFRFNVSCRGEQKKEKGGKMYFEDIFVNRAGEVIDLLLNGAYIYLAVHEEIVTRIEELLKEAATEKGHPWDVIFAEFKKNDQWRVEVLEEH